MINVYRNMNRRVQTEHGTTWFSIQENGHVTGYSQYVHLINVKMKHASDSQLSRIRTGNREVCQWLRAERIHTRENALCPQDIDPAYLFASGWRRLACDPKKVNGFVDAETGERVDRADQVRLMVQGAFYWNQKEGAA